MLSFGEHNFYIVRWLNDHAAAAAKSLQSCPTLCDPIDGSPPGSAIPGILQARTPEWVAISFSNAWKWKMKVKSLSRVRLLATPWTAAYQAPLSMGFSKQEYWSGLALPLRSFCFLCKKWATWLKVVIYNFVLPYQTLFLSRSILYLELLFMWEIWVKFIFLPMPHTSIFVFHPYLMDGGNPIKLASFMEKSILYSLCFRANLA